MAVKRTAHQQALIEKCLQEYGNKGDADMINLLLRTQKNVCSVKTTSSGHRDRFEMDLLSRLHKIRTNKEASRKRGLAQNKATLAEKVEDESSSLRFDLN